jgi:hypothetical protein
LISIRLQEVRGETRKQQDAGLTRARGYSPPLKLGKVGLLKIFLKALCPPIPSFTSSWRVWLGSLEQFSRKFPPSRLGVELIAQAQCSSSMPSIM